MEVGKTQWPTLIKVIGKRFRVDCKPCTPRSRKLDQVGTSYEACGSDYVVHQEKKRI